MNPKITLEHLSRGATVYVRQSTVGQVVEHTESQRRQYALAESARELGFISVTTIDDDLGRSGSGLVARPGFQKLVAAVCSGPVGAVFCIEASRLARNGRDWHHLIDLCALTGTLVIDPDGVYDPRQVNDRLLLGLKGTMSEYELSLLRQRGLAARDSKASRGELRFALPPGYCWNELGRIEMDPDDSTRLPQIPGARQRSPSVPLGQTNRTEAAGLAPEPRRWPDRMAGASVSHGNPTAAASGLRRRLRVRQKGPTYASRRWQSEKDRRPSQAHVKLERPSARPSPRLYQLGRVRGTPADDC